MPPYNDMIVDVPTPMDGNAITDSINIRHKFGHPSSGPRQPMSLSSSSSRRTTGASGNMRVRPTADVPSSSSSSSHQSWAAELFPHSHPKANKQHHSSVQQLPTSNSSIVSSSVHPHIRELVERQYRKDQQQCLHDKLAYHRSEQMGGSVPDSTTSPRRPARGGRSELGPGEEGGGGEGVIRGLHMEHVLNDQYHEGGYYDDFVMDAGHTYNPAAYSSPMNNPMGCNSPRFSQPRIDMGMAPTSPRAHAGPGAKNGQYQGGGGSLLPDATLNENGDYVIEGAFQNKGCVCQTADDVGFLFGCGTHPKDEVVYVYSTQPDNKPTDPPAAMANERNLWYHRGSTENNNDISGNESVNDVLFRIDREYQAMQAAANEGGNMMMGGNNSPVNNNFHNHEFLRDPPPGTINNNKPPHGHYRVIQEDDEYTRASSCSFSGLIDFILPGSRRHRQQSSSRLSPRRKENGGFFDDYRDAHRSFICSSPPRRSKRNQAPHNVASSQSDDQSASSFDKTRKIVKNASDSVAELQSQLKAMVQDRARRQMGSPPDSPREETRQEPSPRIYDAKAGEFRTTTGSSKEEEEESQSKKEVEKLRQEQASLDQARKLLQVELAALNQQNMANMNAQYAQQYGMNLGLAQQQQPMVLSPLTAAPTPMIATAPIAAAPVPVIQQSPMINHGLNNNLWGVQQQQQQQQMMMNNGMVNGMMNPNVMNSGNMSNNGMAAMQQSAMNMMQSSNGMNQQQDQPQAQHQQSQITNNDVNSVMKDAKSVMSHSIFSGGRSEGKFIDNIGAYPARTKQPMLSPKTPSHSRSPQSRPNDNRGGKNFQPQGVRLNQSGAAIPSSSSMRSKNEEFTQSNQMLNDLKIKNALIRQDITRMKNCMGDTSNVNRGGVNVAAGIKVGPSNKIMYSSSNQQRSPSNQRRPFPRTSPPSSPRYELQEDPIARAMQRSDEARSIRSGNGSVSSGGNQRQRSSPRQRGGGGGYNNANRRQQPPSPLRPTHKRDQEYFHV